MTDNDTAMVFSAFASDALSQSTEADTGDKLSNTQELPKLP